MLGRDASWVLTSAIIIFTMQTGFGVLESGCVSHKNEVNIMVKNVLDVVFGGITYWAFGFGFSFGNDPGTNPFIGVGCFFVDADGAPMGQIFSIFLFQLSFSTTATTIVSGAMAERTKLHAYLLFSMLNTVSFSVVAHWLWSETGFLHKLGAVDIAGCGPVHLVGGVSGLMATLLLKPRHGVFKGRNKPPLPSPLKAILGMFMLWWGWLRFCSGSVFIVSSNEEWKLAVRAAVNTVVSSIGGGFCSVLLSVLLSFRSKRSRYDIGTIINGVLGALVSITAICTLCRPYEAFIIGAVGALLACAADTALWRLKIDDPVGVIPVHAVCSVWGLLSVGLFLEESQSPRRGEGGLFKTGRPLMLGIQALTVLTVMVWALAISLTLLKFIDLTIGLRLPKDAELMGADIYEHGMGYYKNSELHNGLSGNQEQDDDVPVTPSLGLMHSSKEFQQGVLHMFADMTRSCSQNKLELVMTSNSSNTMSMEVRLRDGASLADSGMEIAIT